MDSSALPKSLAVAKRPALGRRTSGGSSGQRGVRSAQRVADAGGSQDGAAHLPSPDVSNRQHRPGCWQLPENSSTEDKRPSP